MMGNCKQSILTTIGVLEGKAGDALAQARSAEDPAEVQAHVKEAALWLEAAKIVRKNHRVDEDAPVIRVREHHHYPYSVPYRPWMWYSTTDNTMRGIEVTATNATTFDSDGYRVIFSPSDGDGSVNRALSAALSQLSAS